MQDCFLKKNPDQIKNLFDLLFDNAVIIVPLEIFSRFLINSIITNKNVFINKSRIERSLES